MAAITLNDLRNTLKRTRTTLLAATNGDGIVSRADLENLLDQSNDPKEAQFIQAFYDFLIALEDRPRMRVTEEVIDNGIRFIQSQILPHFEVKEELSPNSQQEIAKVHESALPIAQELMSITSTTPTPIAFSTQEVADQIATLTEGLMFDDYGSEAAIAIEPFFLAHGAASLSPASFTEALGVDPNTPKGTVSRFESAETVLNNFVEQHAQSEGADRAEAIAELMRTHLTELTIIILGLDNHPDLESNHPVYVVGIGQDGNLAGFSSVVIWT